MAAVREGLPEGRYGRSADERADRKLKVVGAVLGACLLGVIGWSAVHYITSSDVTGQLIRSKPVSDDTVEAVLEIRKDKDATAICTVRSLGEDGGEVARKDITLDRREGHFTQLVTLHTTRRASATALEGCTSSSRG
ncbi:DUF4307 domain-containing protein [Streptomyces albireticuli]|uniref:DUF4307 domain-containing protein n=1 Tax=Streptomyces albireticuli TaxID=1940 RepID=A0A2A2CVP0_9ACTN|nr:DUF4307 domain-containing protein [Streptomyces albireticuli]MCD9142693.1 DUF4307 domain-containing protein [Streptomyces albireticuli]MCD9162988.1 DUF4307 domain-containing protein [Streptomyces albireticuli]MCD9192821.1 DUF4307 domain-containing protein [Streptomyces albireticuli]PAU44273.1 hypothetical protein CK936_35845 [Streptomyces albireticuli]